MLEKPSMRGVQNSVVDKYSDQAHFIYELLQNADDVQATSVHFRLEQQGLVFTHNGTIRFTVSDPLNEDTDSEKGALGHINSITSIANSNKTESSIGKFGVGFKAVFQYTQTPHIYDPKIRFKIERFIVPKRLDTDFEGRTPLDTVFYFPFDHQTKRPTECYDEILEKLKTLDFPVLFLSNLQSISFKANRVHGKYTKEITRTLDCQDITVQWLTLTLQLSKKKTLQRLVMFSRKTTNGHSFSIGYALDRNGRLKAIEVPAFCFFQTKETTNLHFIIHAPFLLTDSREGIKAGEIHNHEMIQLLAKLAADSLPILRDETLIDDEILNIIPYNEANFSELSDRRKLSFKPIFSEIKEKLRTETLLPAANKEYSSKGRSFWASDSDLINLISDKQLAQLTSLQDARWVFRSRGKKEVQSANRALADYIDGGDARAWNQREPNLIKSSLDPEAVLKRITSSFIAAQSIKWLHKLYDYLTERGSYREFVKDKPIFLDQDENPAAAYDANGQLVLFLPDEEMEGYTAVHKKLLSRKTSQSFIENFGIKKPSLRDEIYNKILPLYETDDGIDTAPHFAKFFRYFKECKHQEVASFIELIKEIEFLTGTSSNNQETYRERASELYLPTDELVAWFETKPDTQSLQNNNLPFV